MKRPKNGNDNGFSGNEAGNRAVTSRKYWPKRCVYPPFFTQLRDCFSLKSPLWR